MHRPHKEKNERYQSLDSLRGIAALIVMLGHAMPAEWALKALNSNTVFSIWKVLTSGYQCVILFFVLSGFALYAMLHAMERGVRSGFLYILARWVRLYPAYIFSIFFAMGIYALLASSGAVLHRPNPMQPLDLIDILGHLTLVGIFDVFRFNPPIWSIIHEMRISILFPILFFLVLRYGVKILAPAIALSLCTAAYYFHHLPGEQRISSPEELKIILMMPGIGTLHYSVFFLAGALIAHYREQIYRCFSSMPKLSAALIGLCFVSLFFSIGPFPLIMGEKVIYDIFVGFFASGIIIFALCFPTPLNHPALHFLGKISFSLYLIHNPCINLTRALLDGKASGLTVMMVAMTISIIFSTVVWLLIERPSLKLSRAARTSASKK